MQLVETNIKEKVQNKLNIYYSLWVIIYESSIYNILYQHTCSLKILFLYLLILIWINIKFIYG